MKIINKYRSHFIASIGSIAFLGLLILLLCIKPFGDSPSANPDELLDKEQPIDFQHEIMDNVQMPLPVNTQNTVETTKESQSNMKAISEDVDKEPLENEESIMPDNVDSVLLSEIKKEIAELKDITPDDTLKKEDNQQKKAEQPKKANADKTTISNEDRQFYYDNYRAILSFKKVYPYVQKTKDIVTKLNLQLAKIKDNKEKRRLIKLTEKELFDQFEKDVRNMSTSQGKLLLKLISRETDQTAYGLIKTYKGVIPATFWYGVGLIFHENMKLQYDSLGEDAQLEKIVKKYKVGKL
jgi:hypothetical protein